MRFIGSSEIIDYFFNGILGKGDSYTRPWRNSAPQNLPLIEDYHCGQKRV